ncbi:MAG TPA: peptidylprolyl isomerase [Terriglobales bacterium]|jgi:peptidyl-prolyl cis-trans isomerase SurA
MQKLLLTVFAVSILAVPSLTSADTIIEQVVARVNNAIITQSDYAHGQDELKQELQQRNPADADKLYSEQEKDVLRDLIDQKLLLQRGEDLGITGDADLIKQLNQMRKDAHLDTLEDLQKAAEQQGVSYEDFKQKIKDQIITQQVIGHEVGSRLQPNPEEEHKFYEDHKKELDQPEQIRLSELMIPVDAKATDEQIAAAKTKAEDLLAQIRKGGSFEDLTKANSSGASAAQGGDLGFFKRGTLAKSLEDTTFAMKAGDVSDVIRTKQGFVILKVSEHHEGGIPPFKEIEPRIMDAVYMQKLQPALRVYLGQLRDEAYIDIKPGYTDSAASPNESKPIETTMDDPNAKKLKKRKKLGVI